MWSTRQMVDSQMVDRFKVFKTKNNGLILFETLKSGDPCPEMSISITQNLFYVDHLVNKVVTDTVLEV